MAHKTIPVVNEDIGRRLDQVVAEREQLTRAKVQKLIEDGNITLCGKPASKNVKLRPGDDIEIEYPPPVPSEAEAEDIPVSIVYEDDDLLVVNKPKGMVVHPAVGNQTGTLVNALLHHCEGKLSGIGGVIRPGIVHRIDKDTSGLLIVAKNDEAHLALSAAIAKHEVSRIYYALALGNIKEDLTIDRPIGRHPVDRKKMAVTEKNAKPAVTHVQVLAHYEGLTLIRCALETGRTHQIRVHLASIGHPLLGDGVYGSLREPMNRKYAAHTDGQCLHAGEIRFTHPRTGEAMRFTAPLPDYFTSLLTALGGTEGKDLYETL